MKYQFKIRTTKEFQLLSNEMLKTNSTKKALKTEYPYILTSMKKEGYKIEYDDFEFIQEILDEDKVVGIMSMIKQEAISDCICINEVYILPEHRSKGLFYQNLMNLLSQPNIIFTLRNPNKHMINLLIDYQLAKKLENNLVVSYVSFFVDFSKKYTNKSIVDYYTIFEKSNQQESLKTDFYDLNINSSVFFDMDNIIEFNQNPAYIETARLTDSNNEDYYQKLKNVDLTYIKVLEERFFIANDLHEFYEETENIINNYLDINGILGTEDELTQAFIEFLYQNNLSIRDGFQIRKQVYNALQRNEITPKSIILRTLYLIENYPFDEEIVDEQIALGYDIEEECPCCSTNNLSLQEVCKKCGYNLQRNNHLADNLPTIICDNFILNQLMPESTIKDKININDNKLNNSLHEELFYMDFDAEEVFEIQSKMATYELLKQLYQPVYFDVFDYDTLNRIRQGSAYAYAIKHDLIKELKDYEHYFEMMDVCFSEKELIKILQQNNLDYTGLRDELLYRIKTELTPMEIFGRKYTLTEKGLNYLEEHQIYDYYTDNLRPFLFYEFVEYTKSYNGKFEDLQESFINYMESISVEYKEYYKYHQVLSYKLERAKKNSEEYLVIFTQMF